MVHNPKNSRQVMAWCLESSIMLVVKAIETINDKLDKKRLRQYFDKNCHEYNISSKQISQSLYDLKRNNYIAYGEGDSVRLMNKAKIKVIDKLSERSVSDGKYRLVSFDIPERKRANRNNFRRAIKRMGFKQIQKSLWACDKNVGELVEMAAEEYRVTEFVAYFVSNKSNIDNFLAKKLEG